MIFRLLIFCICTGCVIAFSPQSSFAPSPPAQTPGARTSPHPGCADCLLFETIQPGSFVIGSNIRDSKAGPDVFPAVNVTIAKPFKIGVTQVTRAQFAKFADKTGYDPKPGCRTLTDFGWVQDQKADWRNAGFHQTETDPVVCVSREDALAYISWLSKRDGKSYRLPTEAEWHLASAANRPAPYWGTRYDVCDFGNVPDITSKNKTAKVGEPCNDGSLYTAPAGLYKPNPNGLFDMIGNVWEWTSDCWTGSYDGLPADGAPFVVQGCKKYALRGHSWTDAPGPVSLHTRYALPPEARQAIVGFRLAQDITESQE
ncbi:MAG: SUMF1/EgtB/PvdO family nonheme iron enzyme [Parvularculales bacterium]